MSAIRSIIAGEIAASGRRRPATEVVDRIVQRLAAAGYRIVEADADGDAEEFPAEARDWVADVVRRTVAEVRRSESSAAFSAL